MKQVTKVISTLLLSVVLFVGVLFTNSVHTLAAITPQEAKDIIQDSNSLQEVGDRLRAGDSYEKVRDRKELNTAKEIGDREREQHAQSEQSDKLVSTTQNKLKEAAENIKEKLNLDEPLAPSTKEFLGKRQQEIEPNGDVLVREEPGYYQRNRGERTFVEKGAAKNYTQEIQQ